MTSKFTATEILECSDLFHVVLAATATLGGRGTDLFLFLFRLFLRFRFVCRSGCGCVFGRTMRATPPIEIFVPRPPDHLDPLPTKHQCNHDRCRRIDPPSTIPESINQRPDEQDGGEFRTAECTEGFAVEYARVEGAGKVTFDEVEEEREACRSGGDKDGWKGRRGAVVCCEGGNGSGDTSNGKGDEESADDVRCNAFDSVKIGRVQMSEG